MNFKNTSSIYDKLFELLLLFLVLFIPYREVFSYFISAKVKLLPDVMILCLLILYIIKNNFRLKLNTTDLCYGAFLIVAFISTVFINGVGIKSFIIETRSIVVYYIVYFLLRDTRLNNKFYALFAKVVTYNTMVLVSLSFVEKVTSKSVLFPLAWAQSISYADNFIRSYGMFNNPNTFGAYLLFSYILIFYLERMSIIKETRLFYVFAMAGIILTASRSTMLSMAMFVIVAIIFVRKIQLVKKFAISLLSAIIIVFSITNISTIYSNNYNESIAEGQNKGTGGNAALNRFEELSNMNIVSNSMVDGRIFSIIKGVEIFKEHPILGTGFGTYGDAASLIIPPKQYDKYGIRKDFYADNEYIKVLVETGMVGAIIYILFLITIINQYRKNILKVTACLVLGFLGMFYNIFEVQILSFLFWVVLTLPESKTL